MKVVEGIPTLDYHILRVLNVMLWRRKVYDERNQMMMMSMNLLHHRWFLRYCWCLLIHWLILHHHLLLRMRMLLLQRRQQPPMTMVADFSMHSKVNWTGRRRLRLQRDWLIYLGRKMRLMILKRKRKKMLSLQRMRLNEW